VDSVEEGNSVEFDFDEDEFGGDRLEALFDGSFALVEFDAVDPDRFGILVL